MKRLKWTKEQNRFLEANYAQNGVKLCANILDLPTKTVKSHIEYLGLKKERNLIKVKTGEKWCSSCKKVKPLEDFAKDHDGRRGDCKECNTAKSLNYYLQHKESIIPRVIKWRKRNPQKVKKYRKIHYQNHKHEIKLYNQQPENKIKIYLRNRVVSVCKGKKSDSTEKLTGCSWLELRNHLESLFTKGMTWNNYGKWHVDHKRPCASFDLTDPVQQKECFHYTNLQPLWAMDNLTKGDSISQSPS